MGRSVYRLLNEGATWESLTEEQQLRYRRDAFYYSSAGNGMKHVRIPEENVQAVKTYDHARSCHRLRCEQNGFSSRHLRTASVSAFRDGHISKEVHKDDLALNKRNGVFKHSVMTNCGNTKASTEDENGRSWSQVVSGKTVWADLQDHDGGGSNDDHVFVEESTENGGPSKKGGTASPLSDVNGDVVSCAVVNEDGRGLSQHATVQSDAISSNHGNGVDFDSRSIFNKCSQLSSQLTADRQLEDVQQMSSVSTLHLEETAREMALGKALQANSELCSQVAVLENQVAYLSAQLCEWEAFCWQFQAFDSAKWASFPDGDGSSTPLPGLSLEGTDDRLSKLERLVDKMALSLGDSVQASLDQRIGSLDAKVKTILGSQMREAVECACEEHQKSQSNTLANLLAKQTSEFKQAIEQNQQRRNGDAKMDQRLQALENVVKDVVAAQDGLSKKGGTASPLPTVKEEVTDKGGSSKMGGTASPFPLLEKDKKSSASAQPFPDAKVEQFELGSFVLAHSLKQEALNGRVGRVENFNPVSGRYAVAFLGDDGPAKLLKGSNLTFVPQDGVGLTQEQGGSQEADLDDMIVNLDRENNRPDNDAAHLSPSPLDNSDEEPWEA